MNIDKSIFKAYDIRGLYPSQINEDLAYKIAQGYCKLVNPKTVVLGRDVRLSGPKLFEAAKQGLLDFGANVIDIGVITTDMMYFAVVHTNADGGLAITASHNPKDFNGFKMVRQKAAPISGDSGIMDIKQSVLENFSYKSETSGKIETLDVSQAYVDKVVSIIDPKNIKPFKVVCNCNFGAVGKNVALLAKQLPLQITWLNEQPNGDFPLPQGRPDPLIPENRQSTSELIIKTGADFGAAWDADADRCFFFDEAGRFLSGYFTTAVLAEYFLQKYPGGKVLMDSKLNWAVADTVRAFGGTALTNKTGHSFYKERMIREDAIFGGEVSAHYFFKDFYYLDNGLMPFVVFLDLLSQTGKKPSEIYRPFFEKYFALDETNFKVADVNKILTKAKEIYKDGQISELDGVAIEFPAWRFSLRSSNTEPVVRLNLEARSAEVLKQKTEELKKMIEETK